MTLEKLIKNLEELAEDYREEWDEELWESEKIEEFVLNEYLGGKAEGFEETLDLVKKYKNHEIG